MDVPQFRREIVRPTLHTLDMWSEASDRLMVGTACHESDGLKFIRQLGGGPALSFFQIEPATARDVVERWLGQPQRKPLADKFRIAFEFEWHHRIEARLICDMRFACAVARLVYWRVKEPLPAADDVPGLASYWGRHYQTTNNPAKIAMWVANYHRHIGPN